MKTRLTLAGWIVAVSFFSAPAVSGDPMVSTLTLDGLSFISFGDQTVLPIQPGATIQFEFGDASSDGSVPFTIKPAGVEVPLIALGGANGSLKYSLASTATGSMQGSANDRAISFNALVNATTVRSEGQATYSYSIPFTTETTEARNLAGDLEIEITGMRLVDGVWYVQLVGSATNKTDAFPEPGTAVYTVLSGRFDQIP